MKKNGISRLPLFTVESSALGKRYVTETGSAWIRSLCRRETVAVSTLSHVEITSMTMRRTNDGSLNAIQSRRITRRMTDHERRYILVDVSRDVLARAANLLRQLPPTIPLRSLDAIHVACALVAFQDAEQSGIAVGGLVSADHRLLAAAQYLGLPVDNPENYA